MIFNIFNQIKNQIYSTVYHATFSISTKGDKNAMQALNNMDAKLPRQCIPDRQLLPPGINCFVKPAG